jgi:RNA polymerase sigma-70 factor (ECF subfamily)
MSVDGAREIGLDAAARKRLIPARATGDDDTRMVDVEQLFVSCERAIGKFLVQMVGDRTLAEDLLQDVFHDAFRGRRQLALADSPVAWLYGLARNHALHALRRRRRLHRALQALSLERRNEAEELDQEMVAVRDLLERHLSVEDRALVVLRYLHGFDALELGSITGLSAEAVRQRLSRARRTLLEASRRPGSDWEESP